MDYVLNINVREIVYIVFFNKIKSNVQIVKINLLLSMVNAKRNLKIKL